MIPNNISSLQVKRSNPYYKVECLRRQISKQFGVTKNNLRESAERCKNTYFDAALTGNNEIYLST